MTVFSDGETSGERVHDEVEGKMKESGFCLGENSGWVTVWRACECCNGRTYYTSSE
jgi:hypothetical protein